MVLRYPLALLATVAAIACDEATGPLPTPETGALQVVTETTGSPQDPDGYAMRVDGSASQAVGTNAAVSIPDLAAGSHDLVLEGIASNCAVRGDNPRSATVKSGATTRVLFAIECATVTGDLEVIVSTEGAAVDPDGYRLLVDLSEPQPIGVQGSVRLTDLAAGPHLVALGGLATNCVVDGDNPPEVTVTPQALATLASPDGSKAVTRLLEDAEVFVMDADGSDPTDISNNPADEGVTSWR
jgi:hypothetical protein